MAGRLRLAAHLRCDSILFNAESHEAMHVIKRPELSKWFQMQIATRSHLRYKSSFLYAAVHEDMRVMFEQTRPVKRCRVRFESSLTRVSSFLNTDKQKPHRCIQRIGPIN